MIRYLNVWQPVLVLPSSVAWRDAFSFGSLIQLFLLGVIPFLLYLFLLSEVGLLYVTIMKTIKLIVFLLLIIIFPIVIFCCFLYNIFMTGILGVLILGVYFLYLVSFMSLFLYTSNYLLFSYDYRLVVIGIFPLFFIFVKIVMSGFFSLLFLYLMILVVIGYL